MKTTSRLLALLLTLTMLFPVNAAALSAGPATLAAQAREEQGQDFRPATKTPVSNMADYDVIFLGYPIWRADLPMPVYTFLESVDLSGKTIIPFGSHSGGFSRTVNAIAALQPDTAVSEDGLMLFRGNVAKAESEIAACVRGD